MWQAIGTVPESLQGEISAPAGLGWKERRVFQYKPGTKKRLVNVLVQRSDSHWGVVLLDLSGATAERHGDALEDLAIDWEAPGFAPESLAGRTAAALDESRVSALRRFVKTAQQRLEVPGVSVGILQGDRVAIAEGYGVRHLGSTVPPDANTTFMVGSTTKPLTSLLVARLVDQGLLRWETPVHAVLPDFKVADPQLTARLETRHLLCACSGIPRRDFPLFLNFGNRTPATMLGAMAGLQPVSDLGKEYHYSNQMVAAGGFLAGRVAFPSLELGAAYDRAMSELLFSPLGMRSTTLSFEQGLQSPNLALPHGFNGQGQLDVVDANANRNVIPARPSGGVWSTVNDMLRYLALELNEGRLPNGRQWISRRVLLERRKPQVNTGPDSFYGLALAIDRSMGTTVLQHTGATLGYQSLIFWIPEYRLGAVVLTNSDQGTLLALLMQRRLIELVLGVRQEAEAELESQAENLRAERMRRQEGIQNPADPAAAARLSRRYRSPDLGVLTVERRNNQTIFDFGGFSTPVASRRMPDGSVHYMATGAGFVDWLEVESPDPDGRTLLIRESHQTYRYSAE